MLPTIGVKNNLWAKQQSGLYAPKRRNFVLDGLLFYAPLWHPELSGASIESKDLDGYTGTVVGAIHTPPTRREFDGDDYITFNGLVAVLQSLTVGSIEIWWRANNLTGGQALFSVSDISDVDSKFILYNNMGLGLYAYCSEASSLFYNKNLLTSDGILADIFYHIVVTHNGTVIAGYLDTVALTMAAGGADPTKFLAAVNNIDDVSMGSDNDSGGRDLFLDGGIGEVRVYNRVLTAGEVTHNRNATIWRYQ